jgi:hypothetical protein
MGLLQLRLVRVTGVVGIYGASKDQFPARMSFLQPDAAKAYTLAAQALKLRVSDMFRTAEESLRARATKAGVQPPGFSAHNYGLAIDIATDDVMKATKLTKPALDAQMESFGWYCHRKDGKRGMEDWHYNFFGNRDEALPWVKACAASTNRSGGIEAKIVATFGDELKLTAEEAQISLAKMKLYNGEIDGVFGGGSKQALMAFQRAWSLQPSGQLDKRTERTLAYVTAEVSAT